MLRLVLYIESLTLVARGIIFMELWRWQTRLKIDIQVISLTGILTTTKKEQIYTLDVLENMRGKVMIKKQYRGLETYTFMKNLSQIGCQ